MILYDPHRNVGAGLVVSRAGQVRETPMILSEIGEGERYRYMGKVLAGPRGKQETDGSSIGPLSLLEEWGEVHKGLVCSWERQGFLVRSARVAEGMERKGAQVTAYPEDVPLSRKHTSTPVRFYSFRNSGGPPKYLIR